MLANSKSKMAVNVQRNGSKAESGGYKVYV